MTRQEKAEKVKALRNRLSNMGLELVKADPWVPIILNDGVERKLEYSYAAVLQVFRTTGLNLNVGELGVKDVLSPKVFPHLLLAGLITHHEDEGFDADGVLAFVSLRHMAYYATCIVRAMEAAQPDQQEMEEIFEELQKTTNEVPDAPLAPTPISSGSGVDVEILDAPI